MKGQTEEKDKKGPSPCALLKTIKGITPFQNKTKQNKTKNKTINKTEQKQNRK